MEEIHAEIHRITSCPYTPNLKTLHKLVQGIDVSLLRRWARGNPCQVDGLAAAVLEGLELWPYALDLLRDLALIPTFRDAILRQKPELLHTLPSKAIESSSGFDKYAPVCIYMFSAPLNVAIPANVPRFLERLLEKAVQSMSSETIRPVYCTLAGMDAGFLDGLAPEMLALFQDQLIKLLANLDMNDRCASPLCLAALARFASRPHDSLLKGGSKLDGLSSVGNATYMESTYRFSPSRKFFIGKRAQKTHQLAVLSVINVLSPSSNLSLSEALDTLDLSGGIVDALSHDDRKLWVSNNLGTARNLYGKILRPDIDGSLQCAALDFVAKVFIGQKLPGELKPLLERHFLATKTSTLSQRTLQACVVSLAPDVIGESLLGLLRLAGEVTNPGDCALEAFDTALRTVNAIDAGLACLESSRNAILDYVTKKDTEELLRQFADQPPPDLTHSHGNDRLNICLSAFAETRTRLHQRLTVAILKIGLHSPPSDPRIRNILTVMLEGQTMLTKEPFSCIGYAPSRTRYETSAVSIFEAGSTPQVHSISHNWRENVARELSRDVNRQHESVMRMVGDICRDLELRCSEAERPLREEQSRSVELQAKLEESQISVMELEAQLQSRKSDLKNLECERGCLLQQVDQAGERAHSLSDKVEQLRQEFDKAKANHEHAAQTAIEQARQQDLDYLATMAAKDLSLEDQALNLADLKSRIKTLEDELTERAVQGLKDTESIGASEAIVLELRKGVTEAQELAASRQIDIDRLRESERRLGDTNDEMAQNAQRALQQHESSIANLNHELLAAKTDLKGLQDEHNHYVTRKDAELEQLENLHKSLRNKIQADLDEACTNAATAREERRYEIAGLEKKVRKLKRQNEEQAKEVAEARALQSGLMAFVGNVKDKPIVASKRSRTLAPATLPEGISPEQQAHDTDATTSFGSSTSSKIRPATKRTKIHRASPCQTTQKSELTQSNVNTRGVRYSTIRPSRTPLTELDSTQHLGQLTPTQRINRKKPQIDEEVENKPLHEHNERSSWNSDEESFGRGDVFTSTDERQLSAPQSEQLKLPSNSFDETTAEF